MTSGNTEEIIQQILERNKRVEAEKAWEISVTRRLSILILTYCVAALALWMIDNARFWLNALIPSGGYALSTISLPWMKKRWMRAYDSKNNAQS